MSDYDILDHAALADSLGTRAFRYVASAASTNDLALAWLREGAPHGAIVIADEQTAGRGRLGRLWHTPPGVAIAMSIILRVTVDTAPLVMMAGALAVCERCDALGLPAGIKWPNDVQVSGRKICGILPEAVWQDEKLLGIVLGIGVNVRMAFADDLKDTAASLEPLAGVPVQRAPLIVQLHTSVMGWLVQSPHAIHIAWRQRLQTLGQRVTVNALNGIAEGVQTDGALLIRDDHGVLHSVLAGDVFLEQG